MDIRDYLRVLRTRWLTVVSSVLVGLATAAAVIVASTPQYEASAQLFVSTQSATANSTDLLQGSNFTEQRVKSYVAIATTDAVLQPVIADLNLKMTPRALASWLSVSAPADTVLINLSVREPSASGAAMVARAVAQQLSTTIVNLEKPTTGGEPAVRVTVVERPTVATSPVSPKVPLDLGIGVLAGLAIGISLALLRHLLDRSVKGEEEVAAVTDAPVLGVIAFDAEAASRPLVVQADPHGTRAEAFRALRTNLQFVGVGDRARSIVLTSSVPGEGKSTTAANLALTLTAAGATVAVVEADLRRPRVAQYLGLEGGAGLTDVLIGRATLDDVLQPWGDGKLAVLACGPTPPNPSELLGSDEMRRVLDDLVLRFDHVLVDAPPLLPFTDAAVLSRVTGGTLMVVGSKKIDRDGLRRALATLARVDTTVLGVILNLVPPRNSSAYGYGYGYRYGYRYSDRGADKGGGRLGSWRRRRATPAARPETAPMAGLTPAGLGATQRAVPPVPVNEPVTSRR